MKIEIPVGTEFVLDGKRVKCLERTACHVHSRGDCANCDWNTSWSVSFWADQLCTVPKSRTDNRCVFYQEVRDA